MSALLRDAAIEECDALSELTLRSKALWGYDQEFLEACREELRIREEAVEAGRVRVLETEGEIVGVASWSALDEQCVDVGHLFIEPAWTRRRFGVLLWDDLISCVSARGYRRVEIVADPQAEAFYLARGCVRRGERPSSCIPGRMLPFLEYQL